MPKRGTGLRVDNNPDLVKDVTYKKTKDGGNLITIVVRNRKGGGKPVFKETVYYNPYGLPEFKAKASFLLPPGQIKMTRNAQKNYIRNELLKLAKD